MGEIMQANHVNVHTEAQKWSNEQTLHVVSPYSNPFRWNTRRNLYNDFRQQMAVTPNVEFHAAELAYGDRPFEVTGTHPNDIQFRANAELFHKENIINEAFKKFDWEYGAYSDGDFTFTRNDWALEAIHMLQHYDFVQLFSTYTELSAKTYGGSQPYKPVSSSFAAAYIANGYKLPPNNSTHADERGFFLANGTGGYSVPQPKTEGGAAWTSIGAMGGAWAFRRSAFEQVGGLLDQAILGHGDWFMAFGLVGSHTQGRIASSAFHPHYTAMIEEWQNRAFELKKNIGCVDQFAVHHFHGAMANRKYGSRDQILVKHKFDPVADIKRNAQGIYELTGNKPALRDAIRQYFIERDEDNPNT